MRSTEIRSAKNRTRNCSNSFVNLNDAIHGAGPNAWTTLDINICDITADCILFLDAACNSFRAPGLSGRSTSNTLGAFETVTSTAF